MKIVLDTNCLIQILGKYATHRPVFEQIKSGNIELVVSSEILLEYEEILSTFFGSVSLGANVCAYLLSLATTHRVEVHFNWYRIEKDPDDNKFVDCAIAGNADYIVSNDAHFNALKRDDFPKVVCVKLEQFAKLLDELDQE